MMPTPFAGSLVVRREKRKRHKATDPSDNDRRPRRGFKFSNKKDEDVPEVPAEATPVEKRKPGTPVKENVFVFRVRKDEHKDVGKKHAVDAAAVSAALRVKQEKAARAEMRRLVRQKKREEVSREALIEEKMKRKKLSVDQMSLYHMVQRQVKRELRKTMKEELVSFMAEHQPGNVAIKIANPENARMRATIESCELRIKSLEEEEHVWLEIEATLGLPGLSHEEKTEALSPTRAGSAQGEDELEKLALEKEIVPCELKVSQSLDTLQRSALQQLSSTTTQLSLLDASMLTIDRLIVEAEMKKAQLLHVYHDSAFKGYENIAQPKENLRALLKLPARGGVP